tara:strand:- start:346 stop:549 length:204 start_codon:yes stop_codon:yes gene_type:complete
MNAEKWKSVVVSIDTYKVLRDMAKREHRTISGQFSYLLEKHQEEVPPTDLRNHTAHGQQVISEAAKK